MERVFLNFEPEIVLIAHYDWTAKVYRCILYGVIVSFTDRVETITPPGLCSTRHTRQMHYKPTISP